MQNLFELTATLKHRQDADAPSPLGVDVREAANQRRLTESRVKAAEQDVNWRVWKWKEADKPPLWAEFHGKLIDGKVLLKSGRGLAVYPLWEFSDEDIDWINGGRKWLGFPERANFLSKTDSMVQLQTKDEKPVWVQNTSFTKLEMGLINELHKRVSALKKANADRKSFEEKKAILELQNKSQGSK